MGKPPCGRHDLWSLRDIFSLCKANPITTTQTKVDPQNPTLDRLEDGQGPRSPQQSWYLSTVSSSATWSNEPIFLASAAGGGCAVKLKTKTHLGTQRHHIGMILHRTPRQGGPVVVYLGDLGHGSLLSVLCRPGGYAVMRPAKWQKARNK